MTYAADIVPSETSNARRAYIDWARGIAVLLMIEAHTLDAWTRAADRSSTLYGYGLLLGGFAAPFFLWLAGVGVALSADRRWERRENRFAIVDAICRRGLEIFLLAFLFRLQAFVLSPGSYLVTLFRVDILNVMGPAIVACGLIWGLSRSAATRVAAFGIAAAAVGLVTPIVRADPRVDALPLVAQWYVRPSGDYTTFTLLPWAGFVFAGAACGALIAAARGRVEQRRCQAALGTTGLALMATGFFFAAMPSIYRASSFWTSSPTYFAIRIGVMMTALSAMFALEPAAGRRGIRLAPLARFGRSSLFVYWIHVELAYGVASTFWRHRLPIWGTMAAGAAFTALMYLAIEARDRVMQARPMRRPDQQRPGRPGRADAGDTWLVRTPTGT